MLRVLCGSTELEEYGEVVAVGDRVKRPAARRDRRWLPELEGVGWVFDRYAGFGAGEQAVVGGTVERLDAVFTRLTLEPGRGWVPLPGSVHLERLETTAATRRVERKVVHGPWSEPDERGRSYRNGRAVIQEGDESFYGWVIELTEESVEVLDPSAR